jgi:uncharacterized membrane-anchored protein YhcB (DUF1043 family)
MHKYAIRISLLALIVGVALGAGVAMTAERHPEIHAAQRDLREAKAHLERAAHDFGGHRVKAIEHINAALEELEAALQADKD